MNSLITIRDIQQRMAEGVPIGRVDEPTVRRLWWAALETLQNHILAPMDFEKGVWLASPLPALYEPKLLNRLHGWVWAPEALESLQSPQIGLLPPSRVRSAMQEKHEVEAERYRRLPLQKEDGHDPLLIIITPVIQIALALHGDDGQRNLIVRSDRETLGDLLKMLDLRLKHEVPSQALELRKSLANLGQLHTKDGLEQLFWPLLAERLAGMAPSFTLQTLPEKSQPADQSTDPSGEITLLEALTHEIRTPLATIRTLIRSLLRRTDLADLVVNRLKEIDAECTEQIDRFGLIFNAAELQRNQSDESRLASTDLGRMLVMLEPGWSEQLERRGVTLNINIAPDLPHVLSDPQRLELMLGGLIDRNTRGIQPGGTLLMELRPAGHRLKLQILSKTPSSQEEGPSGIEPNADLGPVLSWNPSTGSMQLSQAATQKLLASLGGKVKRRRDSGLTIFFPISEYKTSDF